MSKERAKKSIPISDKMWELVNSDFKDIVKEFLREHRTIQTKKQYTSALRQFGWYVYKYLDNKNYWDISKREANNYINYLLDTNMSSSAINLKKSAISSLNNYIETFVVDDDDRYKNFRNFMRGLKPVDKTTTNDKSDIITPNEYQVAVTKLRKDNHLLEAAWLTTAFYTGCRRNELRQFKTEIVNYEIKNGMNYVTTHPIRGKGKGVDGKILLIDIPVIALQDIRAYVETRGFESEYIFAYINKSGREAQIYESWANDFCDNMLSPILGKKITPHILRHSCITNLLAEGHDMKLVSKYVGHHESVVTTEIYDHRDDSEERNKIFNFK